MPSTASSTSSSRSAAELTPASIWRLRCPAAALDRPARRKIKNEGLRIKKQARAIDPSGLILARSAHLLSGTLGEAILVQGGHGMFRSPFSIALVSVLGGAAGAPTRNISGTIV